MGSYDLNGLDKSDTCSSFGLDYGASSVSCTSCAVIFKALGRLDAANNNKVVYCCILVISVFLQMNGSFARFASQEKFSFYSAAKGRI